MRTDEVSICLHEDEPAEEKANDFMDRELVSCGPKSSNNLKRRIFQKLSLSAKHDLQFSL